MWRARPHRDAIATNRLSLHPARFPDRIAMAASAKTIEEQIASVSPKIESLLERCKTPDARIVGLRDEAYDILLAAGLAYKASLHCEQVGVHPANRSDSGVEPQEVHRKLAKVVTAGFSFAECGRATAVEREPGAGGDAMEAKNVELVAGSSGQLAPVAPQSLKVFSLTCGHTNQALRAACHEVLSDVEEITIQGRISQAMLSQKDPALGRALQHGLQWMVIKWQVAARWPPLITTIIDADNVPSAIARVDTSIQLLLKVHRQAGILANEAEEIDWARVEAHVKRVTPQSAHEVPQAVRFVRNWSGGLHDPRFLKDIDAFAKSLRVVRDVPASMFGCLDSLQLGPGQGAEFRAACIKAMLACPEKYAPTGESRYLSPSDVSAMGAKSKPQVMQAQRMMAQARDLLDGQQSLAASTRVRLSGAMDVRLVAQVVRRPIMGEFQSMGEIGHVFYEDMVSEIRAADPNAPVPSRPTGWCKPEAPASRAASSSQAQSTAIATISRDGSSALAAAAAKGLVVGALCAPLKPSSPQEDLTYTIKAATTEFVEVEQGENQVLIPFSDFFANYKIKEVASDKSMSEWDYAFSHNLDFLGGVASSELKLALWTLHKANQGALTGLRVVASPPGNRCVYATRAFKAGELVLVPISPSCNATHGEQASRGAGLDCGTRHGVQLTVLPKTQLGQEANPPKKAVPEFIAPFWLVRGEADQTKVNVGMNLQVVPDMTPDFTLPVMVNTKAIKAGDEVTIHMSKGGRLPGVAQLQADGGKRRKRM